jgi:hypothetical protein
VITEKMIEAVGRVRHRDKYDLWPMGQEERDGIVRDLTAASTDASAPAAQINLQSSAVAAGTEGQQTTPLGEIEKERDTAVMNCRLLRGELDEAKAQIARLTNQGYPSNVC